MSNFSIWQITGQQRVLQGLTNYVSSASRIVEMICGTHSHNAPGASVFITSVEYHFPPAFTGSQQLEKMRSQQHKSVGTTRQLSIGHSRKFLDSLKRIGLTVALCTDTETSSLVLARKIFNGVLYVLSYGGFFLIFSC